MKIEPMEVERDGNLYMASQRCAKTGVLIIGYAPTINDAIKYLTQRIWERETKKPQKS